ncbi:MAG: hypothetical protein AAB339_04335 [Elusimicrobiota bacterium]
MQIVTAGDMRARLDALGADIRGLCFLIELDFLKGRDKLPGRRLHSLVHY